MAELELHVWVELTEFKKNKTKLPIDWVLQNFPCYFPLKVLAGALAYARLMQTRQSLLQS